MKRFLFGTMLVVIGFLSTSFCFIYAVIHPWVYNGITGLRASFLGTNTGIPFIISIIILIIGLSICFYEAYLSPKK